MKRTTLVWALAVGLGGTGITAVAAPGGFAVTPFVATELAGLPAVSLGRWREPAAVVVPAAAGRTEMRLMGGFGWKSCGLGFVTPTSSDGEAVARPDPVALLSASFLGCTTVRVRVAAGYGAAAETELGCFLINAATAAGAGARAGVDFDDEQTIGRIFRAICLMAGGAEPWWWYGPEPSSAADYREETSFRPELSLQLIGPKPIGVDVNFTSRRIFLQTADEWAAYEIEDDGRVELLRVMTTSVPTVPEPVIEKL